MVRYNEIVEAARIMYGVLFTTTQYFKAASVFFSAAMEQTIGDFLFNHPQWCGGANCISGIFILRPFDISCKET